MEGPMIPIDKGIQMPEYVEYDTSRKYPFADMEVGDSFLVTSEKLIRVVHSRASQVGRKRGWKFIVRKVEGGSRVWRVR